MKQVMKDILTHRVKLKHLYYTDDLTFYTHVLLSLKIINNNNYYIKNDTDNSDIMSIT